MGVINFDDEKEKKHLKIITERRARRGLKPDLESVWKIHGPHPGMKHQVYVGWAFEEPDQNAECICPPEWREPKEPKEETVIYRIAPGCRAHRRDFLVAIYPRAVYELDHESQWREPKEDNRIPVVK